MFWHVFFWLELRASQSFMLRYKQHVVRNKLVAVKSTSSLPYLPTFMSCYFSHVLVNCMHAIHFPKAPCRFSHLSAVTGAGSYIGDILVSRSRAPGGLGLSRWFIPNSKPQRSVLSVPLATPSGHIKVLRLEKKNECSIVFGKFINLFCALLRRGIKIRDAPLALNMKRGWSSE